MLEEEKKHFDDLLNHVQDYIKTRQDLAQHIVTEKVAVASSAAAASMIILSLVLMAMLFLSIAAAFLLAERLNSTSLGFLIVGGCYVFLALILVMAREQLIQRPMMNRIIRSIYKSDDNGKSE